MLLAFCFAVPIHAATYYVDNSGSPVCNNSPGNGSEAAPWCTIVYGISQIKGGDTLNVKAGTYTDYLDITGPAGSTGAPTLIQTYQGATVTIPGAGVDHGRVKIENTSYVTFAGFTVTNWNQGIFVENSDHITISKCTVYNIGQEGIHVHLGSSFVTIDGCAVHATGVWKYDGEGIYIGTGDSAPVDNTNNVTVHNCTIYDVTDEAIELKIGTHDITLDGNTIYNANTADNGYGGAAIEVNQASGAVQHWDNNPNHIIRNNFIHDVGPGTGGAGLNSAIRAGTGGTYYNNVIWGINSSGDGILADNQSQDSYTRVIYHNTVDVASTRAVVVSSATADIQNNIGPTTGSNNLATSNAYYVNESGHDYHLVAGSAPINMGADLTKVVPIDIDGTSRVVNAPPDLGAYEYGNGGSPPDPPTNLTAIVQ